MMQEIHARSSRLPGELALWRLQSHLSARIRTLDDLLEFRASFFEESISGIMAPRGYRRMIPVAYEQCVHALEHAMAICCAARLQEEKPLRHLLEEARAYCSRFDALEQTAAGALAQYRNARARAAHERHALADPVRERAAHLLSEKRPAAGWRSPTAAARGIVEDLRTFIVAQKHSVATGEHLERTIVRWIKNVPIVRDAFSARET